MKSEPIANYIWFGLSWRYLQDAQAGYPIHGGGYILENINVVLYKLQEYGLHVTFRAAIELSNLQQQFINLPPDAKLSPEQAVTLQNIMKDLQRTLSAEANGIFAYIVTDKRLDITKLLKNPGALFAPGVFEKLPEIARYDFAQAGRCIAFELPTAAAFHLLRGTEAVLRAFYCKNVRKNRVNPLLWGPMVDSLRRKKRNAPPSELLKNLDNIRLSFRNPTQHPEKIYDIEEVQDLYSLCIDVVNRMVRSEIWNNST